MPATTTPPRSSTQATTRSSSMRAPMVPKRRPRFARRLGTSRLGSCLISAKRRRCMRSPLVSIPFLCHRPRRPRHNHQSPRRRLPRCLRIHRRSRRPCHHPMMLHLDAFSQKERPRAGTCSPRRHTMGFARMEAKEANLHCVSSEPIGPIVHCDVPFRRRRRLHRHHMRPVKLHFRHRRRHRRRHRHTSTISSSAVHTSSGVPEKPL